MDQCPFCSKLFKPRGISTHMKSCQKKTLTSNDTSAQLANELYTAQSQSENEVFTNLLSEIYAPRAPQPGSSNLPRPPRRTRRSPSLEAEADNGLFNNIMEDEPAPDLGPTTGQAEAPRQTVMDILNNLPQPNPVVNHIRINFHPTSKKPPKDIPTIEYAPHTYTKDPDARPTIEANPWHPFRTRLDFEIAELILSTHMNKGQIDTLFSLFNKCIDNPESFTINSATELERTWTLARSYRATGFTKKEYTVLYKGEDIQYDIYTRPLIDWCRELVKDPFLLPNFRWNAERHYKVNSSREERVIGEPWTADSWWKIQDRLPSGALPFCIILYADKTRLSTFGTAKGYPVIARCANLPANIRNGSGVGGGRLVGWLPIVDEDAGETGKRVYVNFKRVVWHKGFYEILLSIKEYELTGCHVKCADDIFRWLFFFILILSADYEEQCVMALIRGATGNIPCPVCLVPHDEMADLAKSYPMRSTQSMREIYEDSRALNAKDKDQHLKDVGLRDIQNIFWDLNGVDVYSALSWDRLHAYHGGLFSDHLWSEFKAVVETLDKSKEAGQKIDDQFNSVPRWSGLNHFSSVIKTGEFADGSKYEDMSKLIIFSSHNVLEETRTPRGYCLLKLMRSYLELDMLSSLTMHTETTLDALCAELLNYGDILDSYIALYAGKNWNFPKNHSHMHMFRDILEKGVTRNSNTKPNEKAHGVLKLWYRFRTNFKNVAPQILRMNEEELIAMMIRMKLDFLDEDKQAAADAAAAAAEKPLTDEPDPDTTVASKFLLKQVVLGSALPSISLQAFQDQNADDMAFHRFRTKLGHYLGTQANTPITLTRETEIVRYQLMKIHYQSLIDWSTQRDLVRVHPSFHGHPRNDYVLIKFNAQLYTIGQLLTIFAIKAGNKTYELAHVLPFDCPIDKRQLLFRRRDQDLRFIRVRSRKRKDSVIVDIETIERGCLLVPDHGNEPDDFIVINVTDQDMWWRFKIIKLGLKLRM